MDARLRRLGQVLADAQDTQPALDMRAQRARFLAEATQPSRWTAARSAALVSAALACVALGLLALSALLESRSAPELTFEVGGVHAEVGRWLAAPQEGGLPLRFSDGSELRLAAASRARVVSTSANGARVVLERGQVAVAVQHRQRTDFRFEAGPFEVRVVGTRFELSWDPARERLGLVLQEGAVRVSGPGMIHPRTVRAGERLTLVNDPQADVPRQDASARAVAPMSGSSTLPAPLQSTGQPPAADRGASSGHLGKAKQGRAEGLVRRADAARFSGRPEQAVAALLALRAQFARAPEARDSAFLLGRIYADQLAAPEEAARWFERSLRERPLGPFAREASGRLIEGYPLLGDAQRARLAAAEYLKRYRDGPHASLARQTSAQEAVTR